MPKKNPMKKRNKGKVNSVPCDARAEKVENIKNITPTAANFKVALKDTLIYIQIHNWNPWKFENRKCLNYKIET